MVNGQHGKVIISLEDNYVIESKLIGSFNEIGALEYTEKIKKLIHSLGETPFSILVDNSQLEGGTPESYEIVEQYNVWLKQKKLVAKAIVVPNLATPELIGSRCPTIATQNIQYFKSYDEAKKWINEQLDVS